jgi:eukaryotic-like serine/threonine-protein kinase
MTGSELPGVNEATLAGLGQAGLAPGGATLVGTSVRSIKLVELLGSGGMGEVYLGVDERLQRKVAVKALRGDRRMDARARARVLREARVLSQLEHPNICRLYELVEEAEGDYLVMELVAGRNLREALQQGLSFTERLDIAQQIAAALATAHGLSVVHRDLKPDNVMLTPEGVVKVLDFGLARAFPGDVEPREASGAPPAGTESGTLTALGMVMGTPRYMSPEQARGEPATAASDMYSLGLVLQELFTGRPPVALGLSLDVMLQKAMWGESASVEGLGAPLTALIERLKSLVPHERPSAQVAAEALRRVADAPRRRIRLVVGAALAATLVVAAVVSSIGFVRARRAQRQAEAAERAARLTQSEAEAVNSFLRGMLASANPRGMGIDVKVVEVLDGAARTADSLSHEPLVEAGVRETLGKTYLALGQYPKAHVHLERSLAVRRARLGDEAPDTLRVRAALGRLVHQEGREKEAEALLREVMRGQVRALGVAHPDFLDTQLAWVQVRHSQREYRDVAVAMRRSLPVWRRVRGPDHPDTLTAQHLLGNALVEGGQFSAAEPVLQDCLERRTRVLGEVHPDTAATISVLGCSRGYEKRFSEAEGLLRKCLDISEAVYGPEHPKTLQARSNVAWILSLAGRFREAEAISRSLWKVQCRVLGEGHPSTLYSALRVADAVRQQGRTEEALQLYRQRAEVAKRSLGEEHRSTLEAESNLSLILRDVGRPREAEEVLRHVLSVRQRVFGPTHVFTQRAKRNLAAALRDQRRVKEAEALEAGLDPDVIEEGFRSDIYRNCPPPSRPRRSPAPA